MAAPSRRSFLGASFAGLAAAHLFGADAFGADKVEKVAAPAGPPLPPENPARPNTLFLTWHRDPTTTMTVQWVAPPADAADTVISYAPVAGALAAAFGFGDGGAWKTVATTAKPFPLTNLVVHRAEITGLTPGAAYRFRVGKRQTLHRFQTMPAKATDTVSFISGGDCGVNPHVVANNVQAARQDPQFAVIGGDLAYDNGKDALTFLAFLRNYSQQMVGKDGRLIPMVACLGNHEVVGGYNKPRSAAPFFFALFDGLYADNSYATLDFGDYLSLVMLDSGHVSKIGGDQTAWLERTLKDRADHPNVIAVGHVPAYPSFRAMASANGKDGTGADNRRFWVPLFQKYRVPVVLEHHDHTFKRTKLLTDGLADDNGVLYLGDGSWGKIRNPSPLEKLSHLALSSRDYHLSLHRIQGADRFHLALDENGRVMDICRTGQRTRGLVRAAG